jgi:sugar phosphate isomerase/epimerase
VTDPTKTIRIGTMIDATRGRLPERIAELAPLGFESFQPMFWQSTRGQDLAELGKRSLEAIGDRDITISTIDMFGNPLEDGDTDRETLQGLKDCIDNAHHFGATWVPGRLAQPAAARVAATL